MNRTKQAGLHTQLPVGKCRHVWPAVTPLPTTTQYVLVSNLCPECQWGDFDFESPGDGRWGIDWCAAPPVHPLQADRQLMR